MELDEMYCQQLVVENDLFKNETDNLICQIKCFQ